jgi:hypothetical protein
MPKTQPRILLDFDLSDTHSPLGEDSMVRKEHGETTVGDAPTAESFRRKVEAMEAGEDRRPIVETPAPAPTTPPAPKLSQSDILRAAVYGNTIFSPPPGATYFKRRGV